MLTHNYFFIACLSSSIFQFNDLDNIVLHFHVGPIKSIWVVTRGGHGLGRCGTSPLEARPVVRYVGRGPVTTKKFYFRPTPARARLDGSWAELSFPLFYSLKLSKKNKTQNTGQWIKSGNLSRTWLGLPLTSWGPACHFLIREGRN